MRGPDDSRPANHTDPAIRTPHSVLTDEQFKEYCERYERRSQEIEDDPNQQDANEAISGPGRSHFHPADRPTQPHPIVKRHSSGEVQTKYAPYPGQSVLSACRTGIEAHQSMCRIDPLQVRISYKMYCILSGDVIEVHGNFNGKIPFVGIANATREIDVCVYGDTSTDIIICVH